MTITQSEIDELRRLLEAATPGPWENRSSGWISAHLSQQFEAPGFTVATSLTPVLRHADGLAGNCENDADLIVALRNHAPALLAAAERCARIDAAGDGLTNKLRGAVGNPPEVARQFMNEAADALQSAAAEVKALREALERERDLRESLRQLARRDRDALVRIFLEHEWEEAGQIARTALGAT